MTPNNSPKPTAVGAGRSAVANQHWQKKNAAKQNHLTESLVGAN